MLLSSRPVAGLGFRQVLLALAVLLAAPARGQSPAPEPPPLPDLELLRPALPRPAWMGIRAAPGVHVQEVISGGPAERAGLKAGDLITSVEGKSSIEEPGLMGALAEKSPGQVLMLEVLRAGEDLQLELMLGEFPLDLFREREKTWKEEELGRRTTPGLAPSPTIPGLPELAGPSAVITHAGQEERAFLGVTLQGLSSGLGVYLGLPEGSPGVLVEHVHENSPAAAAGIRAGEVLLTVEGDELRDMTQLGELLRRRSPGDSIAIAWWSRERETRSASVTLGARQKDIWVVSPPDREQQLLRADVRESLEARLRMLSEQQRRLEFERASVTRSLEALPPPSPKR